MSTAFRAPVNFRRIYYRDHGVCQICGLPVPYDKSPDKLWSATIDHIVPLSKGGTHEPDNCQLAHRLCNSVKLTEAQEFTIDWAKKNEEDNGRWTEVRIELNVDLIALKTGT
jgi:5-methylcytosine-specific restriction endonuclease McrA